MHGYFYVELTKKKKTEEFNKIKIRNNYEKFFECPTSGEI